MEYRPLGATGMMVSEIGFGTGDNAGLIVRGSPEDQLASVVRALELGVNYFDTSPDYGKGVAETNLGAIFRQLGVRPFITTKVEIMPEDLDDIAGAVVRCVEGSLRRLQMDWVDVVQIHNPPHLERHIDVPGWIHLSVDDYLGRGGALEGLERVRREGKVRYLGMACEHADARAVHSLLETDEFQVINMWYDLLNPTGVISKPPGMNVHYDYGEMIEDAAEHGAGVAIMRPLAGGTLTDHAASGGARHPLAGGGLSRHADIYSQMVEQAKSMRFLSQAGEHNLSQAAVRFILASDSVSTVIGGFSEIAHLEEAAGCSGAGPLSEENMARVEMVWRSNFGRWDGGAWDEV